MPQLIDQTTAHFVAIFRARVAALRASGDRGSGPVETALLIAGLLAAAIAVMAAVTAVVTKYKSRIK